MPLIRQGEAAGHGAARGDGPLKPSSAQAGIRPAWSALPQLSPASGDLDSRARHHQAWHFLIEMNLPAIRCG